MRWKPMQIKLSIYMPKSKTYERPVERLIALGDKRDRKAARMSSRQPSLVVEAILQYLEREE
jgi:hypothetical protein